MSLTIEELEAQLAVTSDPYQRIDLLNALAYALRLTDLPRAMALSEQAAELSSNEQLEGGPYYAGTAKSFLNLGLCSLQSRDYLRALSYLFKSLLAADVIDDRSCSATVIYHLGQTYLELDDYPNALDHYLRAQDLARELADPALEAQTLNAMGYLYTQLNDCKKALTFLQRSLSLARQLDDAELQATALNQSAQCYCRLEQYSQALASAQESLSIYQALGNRAGEARAFNTLGEIHRVQGDDPAALLHFHHAKALAEQLDLKEDRLHILFNLGQLCSSQGDLPQAATVLEQALALAQALDDKRWQSECHQLLAQIARQSGDYALALTHYETYHGLREDLFNEEAQYRLKSLGAIQEVERARTTAELYQLKNISLEQEIAERQRAEEALQAANAQLQAEVLERERLIADLNAFSHMVAHDLKTPLTAINMYVYLLSKKLSDIVDIDVLRFLEIIDQTTARMARIVDELLLLSSVRQQDVTLQPVDMGEVVSESQKRLQTMIEQYQARLIYPTHWPTVMGQARWLEEVWANYISNAIKYGGTPPIVELGATPLDDGRIRFWVKDNGSGVRREDQTRLFAQFTRLDPSHASGYGLGLSIVKRIVEKLGGEVGVSSEGVPGRGSIFSFTLAAVPARVNQVLEEA